MKKTSVLILCLALLLLSACGSGETAPAPAPTEAPAPAAVPTEAPAEEPVEATPDTAAIVSQVLDLRGHPVEELIDWLGEPLSRDYSSSCLVQGGQDGQLVYEGFTVYTLVQPDGTETVYDCE